MSASRSHVVHFSLLLIGAFLTVASPAQNFARLDLHLVERPVLLQNVSVSNSVGHEELSQQGIVVESVDKGSEAETVGMKEGDVILSWSNSWGGGEIHSPFDLSMVEVTEKPRGPLTLQGLRGSEQKVWRFVIDSWGIHARPILRGASAALYAEAVSLLKGGKPLDAAEAWRRAGDLTDTADPKWLRAWLLAHSADVLVESQRLAEADAFYQDAVSGLPSEGINYVLLLQARGYASMIRGKFSDALSLYQECLDDSSKLDPEGLLPAKCLVGMGFTLFFQSDYARARARLEQALHIYERLAPESAAQAQSLLWLASLDRETGNITAADHELERAMQIDERKAPLSRDMAEICNERGRIASAGGDLETAEVFFRRTLIIGERTAPYSFGTAAMLINLGSVEQDRFNWIGAEKLYKQALDVIEKVDPASPAVGAALNNLGEVAFETGDYPAAQEYFQKALVIKTKGNPNRPSAASTLTGLGTLAMRTGDDEGARAFFERALSIQQKQNPASLSISKTYVSLAELALKKGDSENAKGYYRHALDIRESLGPQSSGCAEVLAALASMQLKQGNKDEASSLYQRAINAFESQAGRLGSSSDLRSEFRARHANYYREFIGLLLEQGQTERAFDVLERSRARSLLETLAAARVRVQRFDPGLVLQQEQLRAEINAESDRRVWKLIANKDDPDLKALGQRLSDLYSQYEALEKKIAAASPGYAALTHPEPLGLGKIQTDLLDRDSVLLEYSLGDNRSYVFIVTKDSVQALELPGRAEIETIARQVHQGIARSDREQKDKVLQVASPADPAPRKDWSAAALELARMVIGPVAQQIQGKRLLVVADGALQYIPFSMLPDPAAHADSAEPLVVAHEVLNLPSASALAVLRQEKLQRTLPLRTVAVLADPVFDRNDPRVNGSGRAPHSMMHDAAFRDSDQSENAAEDLLTRSGLEIGLERNGKLSLPRLLQSRREAEAIRAMSPRNQSMEAVDFDASRSTALSPELSKYRIVHFATHGLLNSQHPELSGLVFSLVDKNGNPQNGFLQLQDIYNMNLPADLVVLSACETGLGKEISGEGLIGLTRGFMYAGASRVVASLWKVSDAATAELMQRFYRGMLQEHLTPAAALRQAQISMWKQKRWHSPYYWAAFQIQGDWK